jgi:hypothetical protein
MIGESEKTRLMRNKRSAISEHSQKHRRISRGMEYNRLHPEEYQEEKMYLDNRLMAIRGEIDFRLSIGKPLAPIDPFPPLWRMPRI